MPDGLNRVLLGATGRIVLQPEVIEALGRAVDVGPLPVAVVRPADMLVLRFSFSNLHFKTGARAPTLVRRNNRRPGFLVVELPSQHIVEQAFFEGADGIAVEQPEAPAGDGAAGHQPPPDPDAGKEGPSSSETPDPPPIRALLSGPSRLVFRVAGEEIAYSLSGLLAAASSLPLSVAPHALPAPVRRPITLGDLVSGKDVDVNKLLAASAPRAAGGTARARGRTRRAGREAPVVTAGQLTALSRSLGTAGALTHRFGTEVALAASSAVTIGEQLGISKLVEKLGIIGVLVPRPAPRAPTATETSLELPWRLLLSPSTDGAFVHRTDAVEASGRVELWHSRLAVRISAAKGVRVDEEEASGRTVRAIWTRDHEKFTFVEKPVGPEDFPDASGSEDDPPNPPMRMALNSRDRMLLVHETSNFTLKRKGKNWDPPAVPAERLMLTSLGGWLSSRVDIPALPDGPFTIQEWKHRATMGRDHEVKVVYAGFLFPFGHQASLVKVTERKFATGAPGDPAYLFQRMFIIVRQQVRTYNDGRTDPATKRRLNLSMPLRSVTFLTRVTPNLDSPKPLKKPNSNDDFDGGFVFFPEVDGSPFLFKVSAVDLEGNLIEYAGPMLFVERDHNMQDATPNGLGAVRQSYLNASDRYRRHDLKGQRVAYAQSAKTDDTTLQTDALFWDAVVPPFLNGPQDDPRFAPTLLNAKVVIPAMNALAGNNDVTTVEYPPHFAEKGYAGNAAEVFLQLPDKPKLDFTGQGDRSGGFVTPNLQVRALSRMRGPVGGEVDKAIAGTTTPVDFFSGIKAKLFGLVELPVLLEALGFDPSKFPTFASQSLNQVSALLQDLERLRDQATALAAKFGASADAQVQAFLDALEQVRTDAIAVINGVGDLFNNTQPPPDVAGALETLANDMGAVGSAVDAATALPAAVRNDVASLVRRVQDQVGRAADIAATVAELVKTIQQFVGGQGLPDVVTARIAWSAELTPWPKAAPIFQPKPKPSQALADARSTLDLGVEVQAPVKAGTEPTALVSCSLTPFQLRLIGDEAFIILHVEKIEFLLAPGRKPDVNVVFKEDDGIEFAGPLSFVNTLRKLIPFDGFSDPPYLDVTADGIEAGFDLGLPTVAVGVFTLANISLGAAVRVPFIDESLDVSFNFCTRENPFRLTVWLFGGGGFFGVTITPEKCRVLEASFEFGAAVALDFGVASGSIEVMAGVYFRLEDDAATLTGYFRMRGEVDVLGLISASIELYLELTYEFSSGKAVGRATLTIEVEVLFLSFSVQISCEKKFKGSNEDPTFEEVMGPLPLTGERPWDEYCRAFA